MSKIATISTIPKTPSVGKTLEYALYSSTKGKLTRMPGTGVTLFPFRENNGVVRTALDPNCVVYTRIEDKAIREAKQKIATQELERLQEATQLRLDGRSPYYNFGFNNRNQDGSHAKTAEPIKLMDGDNIFDLEDNDQAIAFNWLKVHPRIASSLQAYNDGLYPSDVVFYVKDEEAEAAIVYAKNKKFNDAIVKFTSFSPDKKKKIARLCGISADDNVKEEIVYNRMTDFLNEKEIPTGFYKGQPGVEVFNKYANLDDDALYVKDLVETSFKNQLYRYKNGKVYEGEQQLFSTKDELVAHLLDKKNQSDLLDLEKKLKIKKLASV